jgi:hypothetical protein
MHKALGLVSAAWLMFCPLVARSQTPDMPSQPYQKAVNTGAWTIGPNNTSTAIFSGAVWQIPDGKILIIQHISARARINRGESVNVSVTCQGSNGINVGGLAEHQLLLQPVGVFDNLERLAGSSPFRCYTGGNMIVSFQRNSSAVISALVSAEFSVTGLLVDVAK